MNCKYICPILTSVNQDGSVNYEEMHKLYDYVLDNGVDGILTGGSAGEFYAFSYDEIKALIIDAIQHINHKGYVLAGTGRMIKSETINLSNEVLEAGADAVIIVGPYYSAANEEDVFKYYDEVMGKINGDVFLYNYADRTGYDVPVSTILRLKEKHANFIGIKDTHALLRHTQKYVNEVKNVYPDLLIYTGYDCNCIGNVISGGDGCIGALSNMFPKMCHDVIQALKDEDIVAITKLQREIDEKFKFYEVYTPFNPVMKWAMNELGMPMQEYCKEPLTALSSEVKTQLSGFADKMWRK